MVDSPGQMWSESTTEVLCHQRHACTASVAEELDALLEFRLEVRVGFRRNFSWLSQVSIRATVLPCSAAASANRSYS